LFDDAVDGGKPESAALAPSLGGEKRLENMAASLIIDALARIGHADHHIHSRRMSRRGLNAELHFGGLDGQYAPVWHGVTCVQREVHDYFFDLASVGPHPAQLRAQPGY